VQVTAKAMRMHLPRLQLTAIPTTPFSTPTAQTPAAATYPKGQMGRQMASRQKRSTAPPKKRRAKKNEKIPRKKRDMRSHPVSFFTRKRSFSVTGGRGSNTLCFFSCLGSSKPDTRAVILFKKASVLRPESSPGAAPATAPPMEP
jgi:hypothetical protein